MAIDEEITLRKLEIFVAFMQHGNMTKVAEAMNLSTVSVHRALHSLEEGMRCPLFKHEGRNLIPLETAKGFNDYAKRIITECESGIKKVRELAGINATRLKIGSLYSLTLRCIPQLIIGMKLRKEGIDIDLTLGSNNELNQKLEDGVLDAIVIGIEDDIHNNNIVSIELFRDDMFLAVPVYSPYAALKSIDLKVLHAEKFVTLSEGFITSKIFSYAFKQAQFNPKISMQVGDIFSLINLVSGGIGFTLLPGRVAEFSNKIKLIPLDEKYSLNQRITLMFHKNRERDPNILALAAECRMFGRGQRYSESLL